MKIKNFKGYAALVTLATMVAFHAPITVNAEEGEEEVLYVEEEDNYTQEDAGTPTETPVATQAPVENNNTQSVPQVTIDATNWDPNNKVDAIPENIATELDRKGLTSTPTPTPSKPSETPTPTPVVTPTPTPVETPTPTPTPTPSVPKLGDEGRISNKGSFLAGFCVVSGIVLGAVSLGAYNKKRK